MSAQRSQWISIDSGDLYAQIDPMGAQLSILRDRAGRDLLWNGDAAYWSGRAPLLFPIVGALAGGGYRLGSKTYHLPRHGFARGKLFEVVDSAPGTAVFRLRADQASLQVYPFRFELDVHFVLDGPTLSVTTWIRNAGEEDMPASFGYHPAFRWPLPFGQTRSSHFIEFANDEPASIRRLGADGLLMPEGHPTPVRGRRLALADALFEEDVVIFDEVRSRHVTYGAQDGPRLQISYVDMSYLGVWTKPGAGFICIEPWRGVADPAGFSGDFRAKPGVFVVAPGQALPMKMTLTVLGS